MGAAPAARPSSAGDDGPFPATVHEQQKRVAALQAEFPGHRISRENTGRGPRYIALSREPGARPHTLITADLGELGDELRRGQT